jgi:hypothetical protein
MVPQIVDALKERGWLPGQRHGRIDPQA